MPPKSLKSKRAAKMRESTKGIHRVPEPMDVTIAVDSCVRMLTKLGVGVPAEMEAVANMSRGNKRSSSSTVYLVQYVGASSHPREVRLRRLLAYGDEVPAYMPGNWKNRLSQHYTTVILDYLYHADVCEKKPHPLRRIESELAEKRRKTSSPDPAQVAREREEWETTVKTHYPLLNILEEYLNPENRWPMREYAIYALAVCAQRFCNHYLKNGFYKLAEKYLVSVEDLFYFIKIFTTRFGEPKFEEVPNAKEGNAQIESPSSADEFSDENLDESPAAKNRKKDPSIKKRRNRRGWGRGIRALVQHWYEKQDAKELVKSVSRMKSHHGWKHADVVKMAHVYDPDLKAGRKDCDKETRSTPSTEFSLALYFILQGYAKTKVLDVDPKLEPIMNVLSKEHNVNREKMTPEVIRSMSLKVEELRLKETADYDIWVALVNNMTATEVLCHINQLCSVDQNVNSDLWLAAAEKLKRLKKFAKINPSAVAIAMTNFVMASNNDGKIVRKKVITNPMEIDEYETDKDEMFKALDNLLTKSLKAIKRDTKKRVVAVLHLGGNEKNNPCAVTMSMSTKFAAAVILLSLWYQYENFDILVFRDAKTVKNTQFNLPCSIHNFSKLIEEETKAYSKSKSGNARMAAAINYARERMKKGVDAFVVITSSLMCWSPDSNVLTALQEYNGNKKNPKVAKLAVWALSNIFINVTQAQPSLNTMDFAGFDAHSLFVLNKFISNAFDQKIDISIDKVLTK